MKYLIGVLSLLLGNAFSFHVALPPSFRINNNKIAFFTCPRLSTGGDDGEALQSLFAKQCDKDGLMTKAMLQSVPTISEMLDAGDLLLEELNDIWDAAPKFPDVVSEDRIDVDSFIQIYRDIDDLFEAEVDTTEPEVQPELAIVGPPEELATTNVDENPEDEEELEITFQTICNKDGLITKQALLEWSEIKKLLDDGLLGDDEFEEIWDKTPKSPGSSAELDVDGFLSFNVALDDLFVFDDDEAMRDDAPDDDSVAPSAAVSKGMVMADDLPPGVLFAALANEDYLVGINELKRWTELQEMLDDEELLPSEFQTIFDGIPKASGTDDQLDEAGFTKLYEAIDALFEEADDDDQPEKRPNQARSSATPTNEVKSSLLSLLADINRDSSRLPCGLECTEREERIVMQIVNDLEETSSNLVQTTQGNIAPTDLAGSWELLYTSSSAMKFNKGLSGLGGSVPNGKFAGLVQKLQATKYVSDVEYVERIEVNPSSASFDVMVSGDWDLRTSVSLFTGAPSTVLTVEPSRVVYGPTSTRADHWKSLGPMNMLDVTYLDKDLRVMRGNTSTDTIFVFRRTSL